MWGLEDHMALKASVANRAETERPDSQARMAAPPKKGKKVPQLTQPSNFMLLYDPYLYWVKRSRDF